MTDPTFAYLNEKLQAISDAQTMVVYCNFCPGFKVEGTAKETLTASAMHVRDEHPERVSKKRIVRKRRSFSAAMTAEREAQIEEERRQRMRALGLVE